MLSFPEMQCSNKKDVPIGNALNEEFVIFELLNW